MASQTNDVTAEVAKTFDTYYRDCFWDEFNNNDEPNTKKVKPDADGVKLDADDAVAIAIAAADYFILNCIDDAATRGRRLIPHYLCAEDPRYGKGLEGTAWRCL